MLNKVIMIGRLTKDPELRTTNSGMSVCSFSIAVQRSFARAGEERVTDFFDCVSFGKTAEFVSKFFAKGNLIAVDGTLQNRSWQDKEGNKRVSTEIILSEASFCESKKDQSAKPAKPQEAPPLPMDFGPEGYDDDLPF